LPAAKNNEGTVAIEDGKTEVMLAEIATSVRHIEADIKRVEDSLEHYCRLARFRPVEAAVFGLIGLVFTILIGVAVVKLMGHQ
jgi:hypothetical protein